MGSAAAGGMPGRIAHSRGMIAGPLDTCDFVNKRRQKACNQGSYLPNQDQSGIQNSISQGARAISQGFSGKASRGGGDGGGG